MFNYRPYIESLTKFMVDNGYTLKPLPKFVLNTTRQDEEVFIKTGNYDPSTNTVRAYIYERHPKDVLRSIAHELIHHKQNIEGRLNEGAYTGDRIVDDSDLVELEKEAYLNGNIAFRSWTEIVHK